MVRVVEDVVILSLNEQLRGSSVEEEIKAGEVSVVGIK
jgi:hypothetical protein